VLYTLILFESIINSVSKVRCVKFNLFSMQYIIYYILQYLDFPIFFLQLKSIYLLNTFTPMGRHSVTERIFSETILFIYKTILLFEYSLYFQIQFLPCAFIKSLSQIFEFRRYIIVYIIFLCNISFYLKYFF